MIIEKKLTLFTWTSKAFDSVAYQPLLCKLVHYKINGCIKNWIEAFFDI